ncbi:oxidoreductase-like domain-containing protein [Alteromonas confluentis]|uniref:Oxidoreductase-like domain-containing protein n=1 Tax=Alteromonas confluentis TaxID=1656094 RepID=A0A1E7Z8H2_9ALTE|nr:oxidoreductase-like domain-containing protein [Alteromonas confluentis]OFC69694.1 hypothetical protein BFC18_16630 [Alteromonas confluentis]
MEQPQPPEKPESDDCCGSGSCYQCVWDVYYEKRAAWKEAIRESEEAPAVNGVNCSESIT